MKLFEVSRLGNALKHSHSQFLKRHVQNLSIACFLNTGMDLESENIGKIQVRVYNDGKVKMETKNRCLITRLE